MHRAAPGHKVGQEQRIDPTPGLMAPKPSLVLRAAAASEDLFHKCLHPSDVNAPLQLWLCGSRWCGCSDRTPRAHLRPVCLCQISHSLGSLVNYAWHLRRLSRHSSAGAFPHVWMFHRRVAQQFPTIVFMNRASVSSSSVSAHSPLPLTPKRRHRQRARELPV